MMDHDMPLESQIERLQAFLEEVTEERDRLQKQRKVIDQALFEAVTERDRLRENNDEYVELFDLLRPLMLGTANALKGDPGPLRLHDQSDLPAVAAAVVKERDELRTAACDALGVGGDHLVMLLCTIPDINESVARIAGEFADRLEMIAAAIEPIGKVETGALAGLAESVLEARQIIGALDDGEVADG